MKRYKVVVMIMVICLTPFLTGGLMSFNAATEEEELIFIPAAKERNMGRKINKQVRKHYTLPVDPLVQKRIEEIGAKLATGTDRRDLVYRFTVLNDKKDDNYNAFCAPGGYIYIFDDLVEVMETDDSVAAVLAHEMGHAEARHVIKRMQGSVAVAALMLLGSQMKSDKGTRVAANNAIGRLMAAYSQHDEKQADDLSVRYLRKAEFDPDGAVGALKALKKMRKKGRRMKYRVYKSHPYLSERIAHLNNVINGGPSFDSYINLPMEEFDF